MEELLYYNSNILDLRSNKQFLSWQAYQINNSIDEYKCLNGNNIKTFRNLFGKETFSTTDPKTHVWKYTFKGIIYYLITSTKHTEYKVAFNSTTQEFLNNKKAGLVAIQLINEILDLIKKEQGIE